MLGAELLWQCIRTDGIGTVFLMPGTPVVGFLARAPAGTYLCNPGGNENVNALVAQAYGAGLHRLAAASGQVDRAGFGVMVCSQGPGLVTLLSALRNANDEQQPLLVISAITGAETRQHTFQAVNAPQILAALGIPAFLAHAASDIAAAYARAARHVRHTAGAAVLLVQEDQWAVPVAATSRPLVVASPARGLSSNDAWIVRMLHEKLQQSQRPVLLLALDAIQAYHTLPPLPVCTTWQARGADIHAARHAPRHPLACGAMGTVGSFLGNWATVNADLIIVLGDPNGGDDDHYGGKFDVPVTASVDTPVYVLMPQAEDAKRTSSSSSSAAWSGAHILRYSEGALAEIVARLMPDAPGAHHQAWLRRVQQAADHLGRTRTLVPRSELEQVMERIGSLPLKYDAAVATGVGNHWYAAGKYVQVSGAENWLSSSQYASIGVGATGGVGLALARPAQKVLALEGDGGAWFSCGVLQKDLPSNLMVIITADAHYSAVADSTCISHLPQNPSTDVTDRWLRQFEQVERFDHLYAIVDTFLRQPPHGHGPGRVVVVPLSTRSIQRVFELPVHDPGFIWHLRRDNFAPAVEYANGKVASDQATGCAVSSPAVAAAAAATVSGYFQ